VLGVRERQPIIDGIWYRSISECSTATFVTFDGRGRKLPGFCEKLGF
jgi:hypothetical protein